LAEHDAPNADIYSQNNDAAIWSIATAHGVVRQTITGRMGSGIDVMAAIAQGQVAYLVPHDSLHYFEDQFFVPAAGAISLSDDTPPGPAHLRELQQIIASENITCILTDPHTNPATVAILTEGTDTRTAMIDPDGTTLTPGPDLYGQLMTNLATTISDCLTPG
jgi:ABC-type Zn2+ transport system substrate-binding protein/surface adhesin